MPEIQLPPPKYLVLLPAKYKGVTGGTTVATRCGFIQKFKNQKEGAFFLRPGPSLHMSYQSSLPSKRCHKPRNTKLFKPR